MNFLSLYEGYEEENFELTLFNTGNADAEDLKTEIKGDLADQVTVASITKVKEDRDLEEGGSSEPEAADSDEASEDEA